jgi:hypothetical protein
MKNSTVGLWVGEVLLVTVCSVAAAAEVVVSEVQGRVTLSNEYVAVVVDPNGGMYVPEATDLATGKEILHGLKLNFPYFEHGIKTNQTAGYRIIRNQDGGVTVAMNMRFCHHQGPKEIERYGRFAERSLSEFVTLRPGEALFEFRGRVDNPTPLRRSYRLWDRYLLPTHDETRIIMPVSHRIEHSALRILPWPRCEVTDPTSGQKVLADCSIRKTYTAGAPFGLWSDYGFMGTWNPDDRINRLRIDDPVKDPGMKCYIAGEICEPWGGTTVVFEDPGGFVEGFVPCELRSAHYMVAGLGEISYADRNVAVCFDRGQPASVQVATPRTLGTMTVKVLDGDKTVAQETGALTPGKVLRVNVPGGLSRVAVRVQPADATDPARTWQTPLLPVEIKDKSDRYEQTKTACDARKRVDYIELQEHSNHRGHPIAMSAGGAASGLLKSDSKSIPALESSANACYRIGDFAKAVELADRALGIDAANEHAFHVKGMIALEQGSLDEARTLLAKAGIQANYVRALMAVQKGDMKEAIALLDAMVKARPEVYRPRLLLAYLNAKNGRSGEMIKPARMLADENPAYPEAQEVLFRVASLTGDKAATQQAAQARDELLRNNPDAERQLKLFQAEMDNGKWVFVGRYSQALPQP